MSSCVETAVLEKQISISSICTENILNDKWVLYHHLPSDKNWTIQGYVVLCDQVDTVEKVVSINSLLPDNMVKYSMLFFMRNNISPLWEDPMNKNGGCFSYKVVNKHVVQVWRHMMYLVCGETLSTNENYNKCINGITISPKKNFCILKIWLADSKHQDPQMISQIDNLTKHGVMFKKHGET